MLVPFHILKIRHRRRMSFLTNLHMQSIFIFAVTSILIEKQKRKRLCSRNYRGRAAGSKNIIRAQSTWIQDYLSPSSSCSLHEFRHKFRVPMALFSRIHDDLVREVPEVFAQKPNAAKKIGIRSEIKVLTALHALGSDRSLDELNDFTIMGAETARVIVRKFCSSILRVYGKEFLNRRPDQENLTEIEKLYSQDGFCGCVGAIDSCKLIWKNCPKQLRQQFHDSNHSKLAAIQVEIWCDRSMYIWHWFPDRRDKDNEKSVFEKSPLLSDILEQKYPFKLSNSYVIPNSDKVRQTPYFLVDNKYPDRNIFTKPISSPATDSEKTFCEKHKVAHKDVNECFQKLSSRFQVLRMSSKLWYIEDIVIQSEACVILHNMIIQMNRENAFQKDLEEEGRDMDIVGEMYDEENSNMEEEQEIGDNIDEIDEELTDNI